jgi:hypothetical protein
MKIRSDSPFANFDEEDKQILLDMADSKPLDDDLLIEVEKSFGIDATMWSLRRFVARLRRERIVEDAKDSGESLKELAELGKNSNAREAALETARRKLLDAVVTSEGPEQLVEVMKTLGEEKAREHELAMRDRAMKVAEENAKLGWRKLELQEARSALKLLPQILKVVTGSEGTSDERLAKVREMLTVGGGKLLLTDGTDG